jgi:hypothetical protein
VPLYYFSIQNGERIADDQGYEFPDDATACRHAEQVSRELSRNRSGGRNWVVVVTDQFGVKIGEMPTLWENMD